jgi:hypothetical protein
MCKAGEGLNLSFESITSRETLLLLRDIQKNKPELWNKITSLQYTAADADDDLEEPPNDVSDEDEIEDEIDVPVDVVMEYMCSGGTIVPEGFVVGSNGALRVKNDSEEYEQEEVVEQPEEEEYGRGKRRAVANKRYNEVNFWRH